MSVPAEGIPTERVLPDGGTRSASGARHPAVLTWQGGTPPSMESVRLLFTEGRLRVSGRMIAAADAVAGTEAFSASFEASVDKTDPAGRLLLRSSTATDERQVSISRSADGFWLVDTGDGAERDEFGGAIDVDVAGSVTFNALPIRRFGLHRTPGEQTLPVVYVSLPDLAITVVEQTYRTVSVGEQESVIAFSHGDFHADLVVDHDGMVLDYPGVARRV